MARPSLGQASLGEAGEGSPGTRTPRLALKGLRGQLVWGLRGFRAARVSGHRQASWLEEVPDFRVLWPCRSTRECPSRPNAVFPEPWCGCWGKATLHADGLGAHVPGASKGQHGRDSALLSPDVPFSRNCGHSS